MVDKDGRYCGIVDDVELSGGAGQGDAAQGAAGRARRLRGAAAALGLLAGRARSPATASTRVPIDRGRSTSTARCSSNAAAEERRPAPESRTRCARMDPAAGGAVMRLTDLRDKKVRTLDGETLGRVHEVHCDGGRIVALMCGPGSLIERLTARKQGRRIPWECVVAGRAGAGRRRARSAAARIAEASSASRSRQGTRRPSAPRSKR